MLNRTERRKLMNVVAEAFIPVLREFPPPDWDYLIRFDAATCKAEVIPLCPSFRDDLLAHELALDPDWFV